MVITVVNHRNDRIHTTVTSYADVVSEWINTIQGIYLPLGNFPVLVGVDVKWCPHGSFGTSGENPIATLQLCVGYRCLIYKLLHRDNIPDALHQFLADDRFLFVGVGIAGIGLRLWNNYNLALRHMQDLGMVAAIRYGQPGFTYLGLENLACVVAGMNTGNVRSVRCSNWGNNWLSREQIRCATVDAFVTLTIGRMLN